MKDIGIAIIGVGNIAEFHAKAISEVDGVSLVAVHNRTPETGAAFAKERGCDYEASLEKLLARDDVDAVAITTPSGTHTDLGVAAAKAHKHVLCEKPLDVTVQKINELVSTCEQNKVVLGAIFQSRFGPNAQAAKKAIDAERFGKLAQCSAYIPWFRSKEYYADAGWRGTWKLDGGGALMNQGIHAVDLLLWLAGDVETVSAKVQTRLHEIEVEDNAVAWLQFKNGALGVIQASTACFPGETKRLEIKGQHGSITLEDDRPVLWEFDHEEAGDKEMQKDTPKSDLKGGASDPKAISVEGHKRQYADFADAIREGRQPAIPGGDGRKAVELITAIYQSSKTGQPVKL